MVAFLHRHLDRLSNNYSNVWYSTRVLLEAEVPLTRMSLHSHMTHF